MFLGHVAPTHLPSSLCLPPVAFNVRATFSDVSCTLRQRHAQHSRCELFPFIRCLFIPLERRYTCSFALRVLSDRLRALCVENGPEPFRHLASRHFDHIPMFR